MNRVVVLLTLAALIGFGWGVPAAGQSQSPLGYSLHVPEHWEVLSRESISENQELLNAPFFEEIDSNLAHLVREQIMSGMIDVYYDARDENSGGGANINIFEQQQETPSTPAQLAKFCTDFSGVMSNAFNRPVTVQQCELRNVADSMALFTESDAAVEGLRVLQYQIPKTSSAALIVSGTCKVANLSSCRHEFEGIMASFRLDPTQTSGNK